MPRRFARTATRSPGSTACTTTSSSTPRSPTWSGTPPAVAGSCGRTGPMSSRPSSSASGRDRCMWRSCPGSPASRPSRGIRSTPAAGITPTPAAIPTARRWIAWPASGSRSSGRARPLSSAFRTWPARAGRCSSSSGRRRRWTSVTTGRSIPAGSPESPRPAGRSAGWRTSWPTWPPPSTPRKTWSTTDGPTWPSGSAAASRRRAPVRLASRTCWTTSRSPTSRR